MIRLSTEDVEQLLVQSRLDVGQDNQASTEAMAAIAEAQLKEQALERLRALEDSRKALEAGKDLSPDAREQTLATAKDASESARQIREQLGDDPAMARVAQELELRAQELTHEAMVSQSFEGMTSVEAPADKVLDVLPAEGASEAEATTAAVLYNDQQAILQKFLEIFPPQQDGRSVIPVPPLAMKELEGGTVEFSFKANLSSVGDAGQLTALGNVDVTGSYDTKTGGVSFDADPLAVIRLKLSRGGGEGTVAGSSAEAGVNTTDVGEAYDVHPAFAAISGALAKVDPALGSAAESMGRIATAADVAQTVLKTRLAREDSPLGVVDTARLTAASAQVATLGEQVDSLHQVMSDQVNASAAERVGTAAELHKNLRALELSAADAQDLVPTGATWGSLTAASSALQSIPGEAASATSQVALASQRAQITQGVTAESGSAVAEVVQSNVEQTAVAVDADTEAAAWAQLTMDGALGSSVPDFWTKEGIDFVLKKLGAVSGINEDAQKAASALMAGRTDRVDVTGEDFLKLAQAAQVPLDKVGLQQLDNALTYVNGSTTAQEQTQRIADSVSCLQALGAKGFPTLSEQETRQLALAQGRLACQPLTEADAALIGTGLGSNPPQAFWGVGTIGLGMKQVTTPTDVSVAGKVASEALGLTSGVAGSSAPRLISPADMAAMVRAAGVPLERIDPAQLFAAGVYVNEGGKMLHAELGPPQNLLDQSRRIAECLQQFRCLDRGVTPQLTGGECMVVLLQTAGGNPQSYKSVSDSEFRAAAQDVARALNNPGSHTVKLDSKTSVNLTVGDDWKVTGSGVQTKKGFFAKLWDGVKKYGKIALTVASFIPGPIGIAARVANGVIALVGAIKNKSVLGAIGAAASVVGGGIVSVVGKAAAGVAKVADGIAGIARGVQGIEKGGVGGIISGVAGIVGGAAGVLGDGATKLSETLETWSSTLSKVGSGVGAVEGYVGAEKAVEQAKDALAQARASGDPQAIAAAEEQLAKAEQAKRGAVLGGLSTAAGIVAGTVGSKDAKGDDESRASAARSNLQTDFEVASRAFAAAKGINDKDFVSAAVEGLGALATLTPPETVVVHNPATGQDEVAYRFNVLDQASNVADAANNWRTAAKVESSAKEQLKAAESALEVARLVGDPAGIEQATKDLDKARKSYGDAAVGTYYAQDAAAQKLQEAVESYRTTKTADAQADAAEKLTAEQTAQAKMLASIANSEANSTCASIEAMLVDPQLSSMAKAYGLETTLNDMRAAQGKLDEAIQSGDIAKIRSAAADLNNLEVKAKQGAEFSRTLTGLTASVQAKPNVLPELPSDNTKTYTVAKGQTLWEIELRLGLPSGSLEKYNAEQGNKLDPSKLQVGQEIKVPWDQMDKTKAKTSEQIEAMQSAARSKGKDHVAIPPDIEIDYKDPATTKIEDLDVPVALHTFRTKLTIDGTTPGDVHQGALGDCFLAAGVAGIAQAQPDFFGKMIKDNGDGSYTITFHRQDPETKEWLSETVDVDADLPVVELGQHDYPVYGSSAGVLSNEEVELWWPLVEKAYALWSGKASGGGSYDTIVGGKPADVMEAILGRPFVSCPFGRDPELVSLLQAHDPRLQDPIDEQGVWSLITKAVDEKQPACAATISDQKMYAGTGLVDGHAYTVLDYEEHDGIKYVVLRNPYGHEEPTNPDWVRSYEKDDGTFSLKLDVFMKYFWKLDSSR